MCQFLVLAPSIYHLIPNPDSDDSNGGGDDDKSTLNNCYKLVKPSRLSNLAINFSCAHLLSDGNEWRNVHAVQIYNTIRWYWVIVLVILSDSIGDIEW